MLTYKQCNLKLSKIRCLEPAIGFAEWKVNGANLYISVGIGFGIKNPKLNFMRKLNAEEYLISGNHISLDQFFEELPQEAKEELLWHLDLLK